MNYQHIYNSLISRARTRILESYTEKHHVIPRCMGGTDDPHNIVELTPEEHYLAHQLLHKIYPEHRGLLLAVQLMTASTTTVKRNNKSYGWVRRKVSELQKGKIVSDETKQKISESKKGSTYSEETCQRMSKAKAGRKRGPMSEQAKENMRISQMNRVEKEKSRLAMELKWKYPSLMRRIKGITDQ